MPRTAPLDRPHTAAIGGPETPATRATARRGGRPTVAPEARRSQTIGVCVSAAEAAQLRRVASQVGMKPSAFLRAAALGVVPRVVPEGNRAHWLALGKLTATLTQLMAARTRGLPVALDERVVMALRAEVRALRCALLGADDGSAWADDVPADAPIEVPGAPVSGAAVGQWGANTGGVSPPHSSPFGTPAVPLAVPEVADDARPFGTTWDSESGPIGTAGPLGIGPAGTSSLPSPVPR